MSRHAYLVAACLGAAAFCPAPAAELTVKEFEKLHRELTSVKEPWQELPWKLSLVQACAQAAKEKKPVYMLCRSGHPLGCV
jgi:hypothetical protein